MSCKPENHGAAKCPDCEDSGERLEKLIEQLDADLRKASRTAHELYAAHPEGQQGSVIKVIKSYLWRSLDDLREKLHWTC
jgi:hypothetical protein